MTGRTFDRIVVFNRNDSTIVKARIATSTISVGPDALGYRQNFWSSTFTGSADKYTFTNIVIAMPTGQPSRQPSGQPTRQPTRNPTGQPSINPTMPTGQPTRQPSTNPTNKQSKAWSWRDGQAQVLYSTYHDDSACASSPRVFDTVAMNDCKANPWSTYPYYESLSCDTTSKGTVVVRRLLFGHCVNSEPVSRQVIDRKKICRSLPGGGFVMTQCGTRSNMLRQARVLLDSHKTNACSPQAKTAKSLVLGRCHKVRDKSGKLLYYSRLEYDSRESEKTTSRYIVLRDNRYPPKNENSLCRGYATDVVEIQYFKGQYLSAKERRVCQQDTLSNGLFVSAAVYLAADTSPTPALSPSPTLLRI